MRLFSFRFLVLLFMPISLVTAAPRSAPWSTLLESYWQAHSNQDPAGLRNLYDPASPPGDKIEKSWYSRWDAFKNDCQVLLRKNHVENEKKLVVSVESLWFGTAFQTGDIIARPVKKIFTLVKGAGGLKVESTENQVMESCEVLDTAISHLLTRNREGALLALKELLDKKPDHAHALYFFGYLMMLEEKFDLARKSFAKALSIEPRHYAARSFLSSLEKKNLFESEPANHAETYFHLLTLNHLRQGKAAVAMAKKALETYPGSSLVLGQAARASHLNGNDVDAIALYRLALEKNPGHFESRSQLTEILLAANRPAEAMPLVEQGLKIFPRHPSFILLRARMLLKQNNPESASRILRPFLQKFPNYTPALAVEKEVQAALASKK